MSEKVLEYLREVFGDSAFMPHGHCYLWEPALLWLQVLGNAFIAGSYFAISAMLFYLVKKGEYVPFKGMAFAFGIFIVSCGLTHLMDVIVIWEPYYWLDSAIRAVTAAASVATAMMLPPLIPQAIKLARGARKMKERGLQLQETLDEVESLYEKTVELDHLKTNFFANVSHELRTPLALIMAPAEKLATSTNLTEEELENVRTIKRNSRALLKHVNDLLELSRVESGKAEPDYTRVDVGALLRRLADDFELTARRRGAKFSVVAEPCEIDADPAMVERVMLNLLANAFKFSPMENGIVRCELSCGPQVAVLEVSDNGPGVPEEQRELVFERFRQLNEAPNREFGGTGLGLAISKDFVELHGGTIEVSDAPEGGALFRVQLPIQAPDGVDVRRTAAPVTDPSLVAEVAGVTDELAPRPVATPPIRVDSERPLVLVVEDNVELNRFISSILQDEYETVAARNGVQGLARALELRPDLIVTDVMMPMMGGDDLLRQIRSREELDATPVLVLSARADDPMKVNLLQSGAQDYLMKPFSNEELCARVSNLVSIKRTRDLLKTELDLQMNDLEELAGQLAEQKRELERALASMRIAREHAENASQMKSNFLRLISHELRSPVAALQLQVQRLNLEQARMPEETWDVVDRMNGSAGRLHRLIEGLLQYSRIESGRLSVRTELVEIGALVASVASDLRGAAEARGLQFEVQDSSGGDPVETDPHLLRLVLLNLVENAVKYTDEGRVTVSTHDGEDSVRISVADTGHGISPELYTTIFEPFQQGVSTRKKHEAGVGLGLALVKELVASIGASIVVDSEVGTGSTFSVILPRRRIE